MSSEFENLGLQSELLQTLETMGFEEPTPIRNPAIPALLESRGIMGQAQTGTTKENSCIRITHAAADPIRNWCASRGWF